MNQTPDENDIVFDTYGIDIVSIIQALYLKVTGATPDGGFFGLLESLWNIYSIIGLLFALIFFLGFIYAKIRLSQLDEIQVQQLAAAEAAWAHMHGSVAAAGNTKWATIQTHVSNENPSDWRLAIIEADIMLEELLDDAGYVGDSIGDKLKTASFQTLQDAWEAHKVRNNIAHAGSDFVLTKKMAQETIVRYGRVFQEFGRI
jgi:hypothetical protein